MQVRSVPSSTARMPHTPSTRTSRPTQRLLPLGSAIIVTFLGMAISAKGVLAYLS